MYNYCKIMIVNIVTIIFRILYNLINEEYEESSYFMKLCKLREEKFQRTLWENEYPKANVTQR